MGRNIHSAKTAGTRFESAVCAFLTARTPINAERRAKHGRADQGDVSGVSIGPLSVVVECKDYGGRLELPQWVHEAEVERENARADIGLVVAKRRGCGEAQMGHQWVVMTLDTLAAIISGTFGDRRAETCRLEWRQADPEDDERSWVCSKCGDTGCTDYDAYEGVRHCPWCGRRVTRG